MPLKKSIASFLILLLTTTPLVPAWAVDEEPSGGTGGETVVEVTDTTLPTLVTARVEKEKITLTTSEPLNEKLVPAGGVFIVQVDGAPRAVVATRVSGNLVTLILEHPVVSTQSVTLSYPPPTENMLQDLSGNALAAIENQSVTNNTPATPRIPKSSRYLYLGDQKIATIEDQPDGSKRTIIHLTDHLGGSNIDTGTNGDILQITDYLPFGSERIVLEKTNTYKNKYRFIGKERDTESDLLYVEARYYDSDLGRFISQDPVFWEAGNTQRSQQSLIDPQSLHSYSYARNNPIVYSDPSGENADTVIWMKTAAPLVILDGPLPIGDIILATGIVVTSDITTDDIANTAKVVGQLADYASEKATDVILYIGEKADNLEKKIINKVETTITGGPDPGNGGKKDDKKPEYKTPKPGLSGKEGAKDIPSWAKGERPYITENGKQFANRLMENKYGKGNFDTSSREFSQLRKYGDRNFEIPK